jgi:DNA polymerase III subunit alpha
MGIEVLVPDVNESGMDFTVRDGRIRFGLSAVRNVGEGVVEKIVEARPDGPFADFPTSSTGSTRSPSTSGPWSR